MTRFGHYRLAFLLSVLIFLVLTSIYLSLPKVKTKIKNPKNSVIKVALIVPIKPIPKTISPVIIPTVPTVKKPIVKKPIIQKSILKRVIKPKAKKVIKKKIVKKTKPKKISKKKIIKKVTVPKVIKRKAPPKSVPYVAPTHYETQPIIKKRIAPLPNRPKPISIPVPVPVQKKQVDNGQAKKTFLHNVRQKILTNKKYPKLALRRHIEGSVKVRFDITVNGEVVNIRFINGKTIFHKSIRKTLGRTFPITIPANMQGKLPIYDVSITLHFNIR